MSSRREIIFGIFVTFVVSSVAAKAAAKTPDYCSIVQNHTLMCVKDGIKLPHVGCTTKPGEWSPLCDGTAVLLPRDKGFRDLMVKEHNGHRNKVAHGKYTNKKKVKFPKASRMATMQWDQELSDLSCLNVQQCQMKHDECRATLKFQVAGQNLAKRSLSYPDKKLYPKDDDIFRALIQEWFDEYQLVPSINVIKKCCGDPVPAEKYGHFLAMTQDKSTHLGCCAARYFTNLKVQDKVLRVNNTLLACNYAYTNVKGKPVYEFAKTAASKCKKKKNRFYSGLCNTNEPISPKPTVNVKAPKGMSRTDVLKYFPTPEGFEMNIVYT